jgi:hypothetical protein
MRMRALKAFRLKSTGDFIAVGQEFTEATAGRAQHYEQQGFARSLEAPKGRSGPATNKAAQAPLAGSRTGGGKQPSSSARGRAPKASTSTARGDGQGS